MTLEEALTQIGNATFEHTPEVIAACARIAAILERCEADKRLAYSVAELAAASSVSEQSVRREIEDGNLKAVRVRGRLVISTDAAQAWLNR